MTVSSRKEYCSKDRLSSATGCHFSLAMRASRYCLSLGGPSIELTSKLTRLGATSRPFRHVAASRNMSLRGNWTSTLGLPVRTVSLKVELKNRCDDGTLCNSPSRVRPFANPIISGSAQSSICCRISSGNVDSCHPSARRVHAS